MKRATVDADHAKKLEDMMTVRFKAVFDSLDRLKKQWDGATREIQRTHAADVRVTRLVQRDHNQRLKSLERRIGKAWSQLALTRQAQGHPRVVEDERPSIQPSRRSVLPLKGVGASAAIS